MKNIYIVIISLFFLYCKPINNANNCTENSQFKKQFFSNINYIEKNISVKQDEQFRTSLKFISKYAYVSYDSMLNYARTYPIGIFEDDKKGWLKWYDENKCSNIQFK
ncbi:hypothetical protein FMM05_14910 [Flavobacterium zepuense]|uniref:Uncharacterized protein n=1 Tax=Flavobacterium zepuense TaxID=2593302 RepID=A0A552UXM7_9FLAO|nr:hypothetical protein [Flavobacterium zepuense]TRW22986.1 hypothetical protein FMM05_14910 [Flavobacterium zepuense]